VIVLHGFILSALQRASCENQSVAMLFAKLQVAMTDPSPGWNVRVFKPGPGWRVVNTVLSRFGIIGRQVVQLGGSVTLYRRQISDFPMADVLDRTAVNVVRVARLSVDCPSVNVIGRN
jgi:hypothetical protein